MNAVKILSKTEFYADNDYAKSLRAAYNNDYTAYYSKIAPIFFENPLKANHEAYVAEKKAQHLQALAKRNKAENIWNEYRTAYENNLAKFQRQNNGKSVTSKQRALALNNAGNGASAALLNFNKAKFDEEYTFSLLHDASLGSVSLLS